MGLWRQTWLLLGSELRQELRSFEVVATAGFYAMVLLALFALSLGVLPREAHVAAVPGALWLGVAFIGALTLTRVFDREREADTLRALLIAPVERLAIYFAKGALVLLVLAVAVAVLVPGLALLFPAASALLDRPLLAAGLVLLGCVGYVAVGTLFASGLATSGGKNVLLALILYPLTTPVLMFNLVATRALVEGHPDVGSYLARLAALDVILVGVGAWLFEPLLVGGRAQARGASGRPRRP